MAKPKAIIGLENWEDFMEDISAEFSDEKLLEVATDVVKESVLFVNKSVGVALNKSKFSFEKGVKGSQGKTRESFIEVQNMPIEVVGMSIRGYAGINAEKASEGLILAIVGSPSGKKDTQLSNAIRVKGQTKKALIKLQGDIFVRAWREMNSK